MLFFDYVSVIDLVSFVVSLLLRCGTLVRTLCSVYWNMLQLILCTSISNAETNNLCNLINVNNVLILEILTATT